MEITTEKSSLPTLKALASDVRLEIINILAEKEMNITELSKELYMSSAMVSRHVNQLEQVNLIKTKRVPDGNGSQKICSLAIDQLFIRFPKVVYPEFEHHQLDIKLGHFFDFEVTPTCGLATTSDYIGELDEPKHFMNPERVDASLLWFNEGFVEYKIPNVLDKNQKVELLEVSLEISSEFPVSNNNWPSDITFFINDISIGTWTVPGNFSDVKGKLSPDWWPRENSQYGLLKILRINSKETLIDGEKISAVNLSDISFDDPSIRLKIAVNEDAKNAGGLTIFGKGFGNHDQDIQLSIYYSNIDS